MICKKCRRYRKTDKNFKNGICGSCIALINKKQWNKGLTKETDERVKKNSEKLRGIKRSEETKKKLSYIQKGRTAWNKELTKNIDERVKRNGESTSKGKKGKPSNMKGKKHSLEARIRMSINYNSKGMTGKKHAEETKNKISKANKGKTKGRHLYEEHKNKISKSNIGKILSDETKKKLHISNLGKKHTEETKRKMSKNHSRHMKGKKLSLEARMKISKANKGRFKGENHPMYEKNHTEETKKKISKMKKNKKLSDETKKKMSIARKERIVTEEMKRKISKNNIGKNRGEKSGMWLGGISFEPYNFTFNDELKEKIKRRENNKCFICSKKNHMLSIHHINYNKKDDSMENLVALCGSCHSATNSNRDYWIEFFKTTMKEVKNKLGCGVIAN